MGIPTVFHDQADYQDDLRAIAEARFEAASKGSDFSRPWCHLDAP